MNRDTLILKWNETKKELDRLKAEEIQLRSAVVALSFTDVDKEGTQNLELGQGYKLKCIFKTNYSFTDKDALEKALSKIEKLGAEGEYIAERLVKFKPELSISEYKKLDNKYLKIINEVIVTKPGTPTLELVEPK